MSALRDPDGRVPRFCTQPVGVCQPLDARGNVRKRRQYQQLTTLKFELYGQGLLH